MRQRGVGGLIVAAVLIVIGVIALINNLGWTHLGWGNLWPVILIVIGALILWGRTRMHSSWSGHERVVGDIKLGDAGVLQNTDIQSGVGNVQLDLTRAQIPQGETTVSVEGWIGNIDILVPADLAVSANGTVTLGSVTLLEHKSDGFFRNLAFRSPDYDTAAKKVKIDMSIVIGDAKVRRTG